MTRLAIALCISSLAATACSDEKSGNSTTPTNEPTAASSTQNDHGEARDLGEVTLLGKSFHITSLGTLVPGEEGAFSVTAPALTAADHASVSLFLWVEDEAQQPISSPAKGTPEKEGWHFHATPRADAGAPIRVVLRARGNGQDERAGLPLDGHGHEHVATPHDGVVASFKGSDNGVAGHLELKLHDDKGDLELWLGKDAELVTPFDLPLDAEINLTFIDHDNRQVVLRARNHQNNEDEEGNGNIRNGATHYFIFPGDSGSDASWLTGTDFQSIVEVTFDRGSQAYASEEFVLTPHTHGDH